MSTLSQITIAPRLTFDALVAGEPGAPLVLLLHGFAESMHTWRSQVTALADAGYRAVAPSQRGYSPGARPDTRDASNYHIERHGSFGWTPTDVLTHITGFGSRKGADNHELAGRRSDLNP